MTKEELIHLLKVLAPFYHSAMGDYNRWAHGSEKRSIGEGIKAFSKVEAQEKLRSLFPLFQQQLASFTTEPEKEMS